MSRPAGVGQEVAVDCTRQLGLSAGIQTHAARGALFETYVVSAFFKQRFNAGQGADLFSGRDNAGHEVDLLIDTPQGMQAVEIKAGSTFASDWPEAIGRWRKFAIGAARMPLIVYGGEGAYERQGCRVIGWREIQGLAL